MTKFAINFESDGLELVGLTPTFLMSKNLDTGNDVTPLPTVSEVANGFYRYDIDGTEGEKYIGKITGGVGVGLPENRFKYVTDEIPYDPTHREIFSMPVYDPDADSILFMTYMLKDGQTVLTNLVEARVTMYDSSNIALFSITSTTFNNGVAILTKATPGLVSGEAYYVKIEITRGAETFTTTDTFKVLE